MREHAQAGSRWYSTAKQERTCYRLCSSDVGNCVTSTMREYYTLLPDYFTFTHSVPFDRILQASKESSANE